MSKQELIEKIKTLPHSKLSAFIKLNNDKIDFSDDDIVNEIIKKAKQTLIFSPEILDELLNNNVSSKILVEIIYIANNNDSIVIRAIYHPNANEEVLKAAESYAKRHISFPLKEIKYIEDELDTLEQIRKFKETNEKNNLNNTSDKRKNLSITIEIEDDATERLRVNVEDGCSTMLWGRSGVGKTARVRQIDPTYTEIMECYQKK